MNYDQQNVCDRVCLGLRRSHAYDHAQVRRRQEGYVEKVLILESQHTQAIALGAAYATMQALSREKNLMNEWMVDIWK